jgi:hypothetical protein
MALTTPDWLARHGCSLGAGGDGQSYLVLLGREPQYLLMPVPADGKFGCAVMQTNSGKRLDGGATYPTVEEALRGGLEDLRKALGW